MRRTIIYIIGIVLLMASCDLEHSDNGDLDGFWQLYQLDTLSTGGVTDMRDSMTSWSFQMRLMEIRGSYENAKEGVLFRFEHKADSLILSNPYYSDRMVGDVEITDAAELRPLGIYHLREPFYIEALNDDRMHLRTDRLRFHFRKY